MNSRLPSHPDDEVRRLIAGARADGSKSIPFDVAVAATTRCLMDRYRMPEDVAKELANCELRAAQIKVAYGIGPAPRGRKPTEN